MHKNQSKDLAARVSSAKARAAQFGELITSKIERAERLLKEGREDAAQAHLNAIDQFLASCEPWSDFLDSQKSPTE